jgi:23S rRNA pseudouridine2605 synthase
VIRLNKLLSQAGVASRRVADDLISQGRVELNGHVVTELGTKADPERDHIKVDGRKLKGAAPERRYLLMNKPAGVLSTRADEHKRRTVLDVMADNGIRGYFYPVGRLDYDTEGLIILTNDGALAERVTHPRYMLERAYEVIVAGTPEEHDLERLRKGVVIDGHKTLPAEVKLRRVITTKKGTQAVVDITIKEGRNRQVRKMCDAIGHPVDHLRRTRIGPIMDLKLKVGAIRDLSATEVRALTQATAATVDPESAIGKSVIENRRIENRAIDKRRNQNRGIEKRRSPQPGRPARPTGRAKPTR